MTYYSNGTAIIKTVTINASVSKVWDALTNTGLIKQWMLDTEIEVISSWQAGSPIIFRGSLDWIDFENKGIIIRFEPYNIFQYNFWSTLSNLPDMPENYTTVDFTLTTIENETVLTLSLNNFPTEVIYKHLDFYWTVTLSVLKKLCERI